MNHIICLKSVCLSVDVRRLQVAILARSPREMSQTDRILPMYFLSLVRVSGRPRFGAIVYFNCNRSAIGVSDCHCVDHQRHRRRASLTPSWLDRPTTERPRRWGVFVCLFGCLFGNAYKLCVCARMRACVRTCVRACVRVYVRACNCMYVCARARIRMCACTCVRACVCASVRACVCACVCAGVRDLFSIYDNNTTGTLL